MKLAQMSTWTKRIYDTFVLLDIVEKYVIEPTKVYATQTPFKYNE